ncbi:MAG: potassium transporter TrkA [Actinobacteria bacterium]|nr:cation:proton antiporter regulatory subunit [Actinomycetota bacterium]NIU64569.1 cation:proton antiporter regulatory subunit [Actinomycetota bacterium]NIW27604.1 potassium transporter TrkA [Actinomycetota bacterium]NIX18923.1 potassium transporter TrkA [Actinomycetota bacterium]
MTVYETEIPGVGHKFELELDDGGRLVVLVHHDGRREVFRRPGPEADSEKLFDLSAADARRVATLLQGATFETVAVEDLEVPLGEAIIEWTEVEPGSALDDTSLGDAHLRRETGVSVLAVQRGEETVPNPDPDVRIEAGDVLVALGTREEHAALHQLAADG